MGRDISLPFSVSKTTGPKHASLLEDAINDKMGRRTRRRYPLNYIDNTQCITLKHHIMDADVKSKTHTNL